MTNQTRTGVTLGNQVVCIKTWKLSNSPWSPSELNIWVKLETDECRIFNRPGSLEILECKNIDSTLIPKADLTSPCKRLARGKFELTNQDSAGGKNFSVLKSV